MISSCSECGFDYAGLSPAGAASSLRAFERRYRAPFTRFLPGEDGDALVRRRPAEGVWSALEYAGHVRNSLKLAQASIGRALAEDHPNLPPVDPDEEVARLRFNDEDPTSVAGEVAAAATSLAALVESVPDSDWSRKAAINGAGEIDALWLARNAVHEANHHLLDIGRVLRAAREDRSR